MTQTHAPNVCRLFSTVAKRADTVIDQINRFGLSRNISFFSFGDRWCMGKKVKVTQQLCHNTCLGLKHTHTHTLARIHTRSYKCTEYSFALLSIWDKCDQLQSGRINSSPSPRSTSNTHAHTTGFLGFFDASGI